MEPDFEISVWARFRPEALLAEASAGRVGVGDLARPLSLDGGRVWIGGKVFFMGEIRSKEVEEKVWAKDGKE
jgi:hypothetical protein